MTYQERARQREAEAMRQKLLTRVANHCIVKMDGPDKKLWKRRLRAIWYGASFKKMAEMTT